MLAGTMAVPIQRELGLGSAAFGAAVSAFYLTVSLSSVLAGRTVDRVGWRVAVRATAAISALALGGIGLLARSPVTLVAFLVIGGVAQSLAGPASNTAVLNEFPDDRQGLLFGVKQMSVPISTMVAGLAVPIVTTTVGWRWAFLGGAATPLVIALWPRAGTVSPVARARRWRRQDRAGDRRPPARPSLEMPRLVVLSAAVGLASVANITLSAFLVASSVDAGLSESAAGWVIVAGSVVGLVVRVASGWAMDRRPRRVFALIAVMNVGGVAGMALLATGRADLVLLGAVLGFGAGWGWSGMLHYGVVRHHPHAPAGATGVVQVGLAGGAGAGPILSGAVIDRWGYSTAWLVAAVVLASSSGLFLWASSAFDPRSAVDLVVGAE